MKVIALSTAFGLGWLFRLTVAQTIAIAASGLFTFVGEAGRKPNVRLAVRHWGTRSGQPVAGGPAHDRQGGSSPMKRPSSFAVLAGVLGAAGPIAFAGLTPT